MEEFSVSEAFRCCAKPDG